MTVSTSASVVSDSCRLTVVSSTRRADLAVPVQISVAELLTVVVAGLGPDAADLGAAEGGWVLQRAGSDPLDPATTLASGGIVDGDVLHLRTRSSTLPEVAFDDVLDAVADGVLTRTRRWSAVQTMRATTFFAAVLLAFAGGTALLVGPTWGAPAVTLGVGALLLAAAAVAVGRIVHRRGPALTAAGFAIAYGAGCGATALGGGRHAVDFGAPQLLAATGAALLTAVVLLIVLADGLAGFVAVIALALLGASGAIASGLDLRPAAAAAVIAALGLASAPTLPMMSYRLARLPLAVIPLDAADPHSDTAGLDARQILGRAVRADQFLTGLVGGGSLAVAGSAVVLAGHGVSEEVLAAVLGGSCLLRARLFTGLGQRILLLLSGAAALVAELVAVTTEVHGSLRLLALAVPAAVVGLALVGLSVVLPDRRYAPTVSRAADILESVLVLSVIPLAIGVLGVYGSVRQLVS